MESSKRGEKSMFNKFLNLFTKTVYEKDNLNKKEDVFYVRMKMMNLYLIYLE